MGERYLPNFPLHNMIKTVSRRRPRQYRKTNLTKKIKSVINRAAETKLFTPPLTAMTPTSTNFLDVEFLQGIAEGDEYKDRNGREIDLKSIEIYGWVTQNALMAVNQFDYIRMVLAEYDTSINAPLAGIAYDSALNKSVIPNLKRVLIDKRFILKPSVSTQTPGVRAITFKHYFKGGLKISYTGNTGPVQQTSLCLSIVSYPPAAGKYPTFQPTANYIKFKDI